MKTRNNRIRNYVWGVTIAYKVSIDKAVVQFSFFEGYCELIGNKTADTPLNPDKDKSNTIETVL